MAYVTGFMFPAAGGDKVHNQSLTVIYFEKKGGGGTIEENIFPSYVKGCFTHTFCV